MSTKPITVTPDSDIVGNYTSELKQKLANLIQNGQQKIVLDLKAVSMIDSLGVGVLVATRNSIQRSQGELQIINLSDDLKKLFSNMRIIDFLNIS